MNAPSRPIGPRAGRRQAAPSAPTGGVVALDARRIAQALAGRSRYQYVRPRIAGLGDGWLVHSPNCSRNIDPGGGEIPIAWFEPAGDGRWRLHAHDHAQGCWRLQAQGLSLAQALAIVCEDSARLYWP